MATLALDYDEMDQVDDSSETERSEVLRKQKLQARRQRQVQRVKTTGRSMEAAGATTQAAGKGVKLGGRATAATGRGLERVGTRMSASGAELSATGAGAIVGVPLAILGGATTAIGAGTQALGAAATEAGQVMDSSGRALRQQGAQLSKSADQAGQLAGSVALDKADSLRQAKKSALSSKLTKLAEIKGAAGDDNGSLLSNAFRLATDFLLRESWISLIPSWGLTLIWINIHVFLGFILGDQYFNKLGHEWLSAGFAKLETAATSKAAGQEFQKMLGSVGDKIGFLEVLLVLLLDILVLLILMIIVALIAGISYFIYQLVSPVVDLIKS